MPGKKENQQEILFQLSMFEQQIQQLQQQLDAVERGIVELSSLSLDLNDLVGKKDSEIFASVGKGIFAKARLLSDELIVDVGGKRFVAKTIGETQNLIAEQVKKLEDVKRELNGSIDSLSDEAKKIIQGFSKEK